MLSATFFIATFQLDWSIVQLPISAQVNIGSGYRFFEKKQLKAYKRKNGVSRSPLRKVFLRIARVVLSTKDLGMGLARLDPHKVAPVVLGGIYCLASLIEGASEDDILAVKCSMDIVELVALWATYEKQHMVVVRSEELKEEYQKLGVKIIKMQRIAKIIVSPASQCKEWERLRENIKSYETNCNNLKSKINLIKERQERDSTILKWLSSHDSRKEYKDIQNRTKIHREYSNHCQWVVERDEFEEWYRPGRNSVFWLKGTIGTGKTTIMARAVNEIRMSSMVDIDANPLAFFFFAKSRTSASSLCADVCLRSLLRQLSWSYSTSSIHAVVETKYNEFQDSQAPDSSLSLEECVEVLKSLMSNGDTYIMIDALDECENAEDLLTFLKEIFLHIEDSTTTGFLHMMLCGRSDLLVSDYFGQCHTITTNSTASLEEQHNYVETEVNRWSRIKDNSLFFKSEKNFPDRLKKILKNKAQGLFRWIEIQIQFFTQQRFRTEKAIEDELNRLEKRTIHPELNKEYDRLFDLLKASEHDLQRAIKMLKLLSCLLIPLNVERLAEAITWSETNEYCTGLTGDDVRCILVGFISESEGNEDEGESPLVTLAHASVMEYLTLGKSPAGCFTLSAQHSEAASLCIASITYATVFDIKDMPDSFVIYSYFNWPYHLATKNFLLKDHDRWQRNISEYARRPRGTFFLITAPLKFRHSIQRSAEDTYEFLVAAFNLTALLEFPEIRQTIKFSAINAGGWNLFDVCFEFAIPSTFSSLLNLFPVDQVWNGEFTSLMVFIYQRFPEDVGKILKHRSKPKWYLFSLSLAIEDALRSIAKSAADNRDPLNKGDILSKIIQSLLVDWTSNVD
ncbi:hypothetical protein B0J11DRAFT_603123 [Dendryphion nanum]|uniref:Nephrocystin 3-like N-terminal domain-containing protein n=1 Tax=Dendryphion nanum TaxID=256645 RepID=A0A9P9IRP3_9PLEO|nr:hypothetical protein B0J11DRAFT_603123 [Dendryphion nanum]